MYELIVCSTINVELTLNCAETFLEKAGDYLLNKALFLGGRSEMEVKIYSKHLRAFENEIKYSTTNL